MVKETFYVKYVKSTMDRVLGVVGILCFWWLYLVIAIAIKVDDPKGPVIFKQERLGKNGKVYWMYKFRSMRVGAEHTGSGVYSDGNDPRVTHIGRILRSTSLDGIVKIGQTLKNPVKSMVSQVSPKQFLESCSFNFLQHNRNLVDDFPTCQTVWIG
jgi:lipopolysaccharide/colanic/teichoic acid biosynthesis glycosyltransferase